MSKDVVRRLLGPDRVPLSCEQCFDELDRYVESRLADAGTAFETCPFCRSPGDCSRERDCLGMRAHLESCAACDEEYASLRELVVADRVQPDGSPKAR